MPSLHETAIMARPNFPPSPQGDGDPGDDQRPMPVVSDRVREWRCQALARELAPLLFAAKKAHAGNDDRLWDDLTLEQREPFLEAAREAIYRQDPLRHEHAIRQMRITFGHHIDSFFDPEIKVAETQAGSTIGRYVRALLRRVFLYMTSETANVCGDLLTTYQVELVPRDAAATLAKRREMLARIGGGR